MGSYYQPKRLIIRTSRLGTAHQVDLNQDKLISWGQWQVFHVQHMPVERTTQEYCRHDVILRDNDVSIRLCVG